MEEREASRAHRKHTMVRAGAFTAGAAVVVLMIGAAVATVRRDDVPAAAAPARDVEGPTGAAGQPGAAGSATPPVHAVPAGPLASPIVLPMGRTVLDGGLFAERTGDTVIVHFDTPATRTRRMDKFERVVRATLPAVLGAEAAATLAQIQEGTLLRGASPLAGPSAPPLRIAMAGGRVALVTPMTRPGQDGPLVVAYRVVAEQAPPQR